MQIFQTTSSTRWNRFKWIGVFILLTVIVSATVLIVALQQVYTPALPRLNDHVTQLVKWQPDDPAPFPARQLAPGFQKYIAAKESKAAQHCSFAPQYQSGPPPPSVSAIGGLPQAMPEEVSHPGTIVFALPKRQLEVKITKSNYQKIAQ